jgi:DNA-binding winged helix-turn-helix (wHTH) protein/Tfp pilus assembly protein PilF
VIAKREQYRFGEFTLDVTERRLSRNGTPIRVGPKTYDVLVALVRQAGRLVTKSELLEQVWPGAFVEEGILTVHTSSLRKVLGDVSRDPAYIETIPGSGYRFVANVSTLASDNHGTPLVDPPRPLEAYDLVGRGRAHLLSASLFELSDAVSAFTAAIEMDNTYAAAHAGLARAWCEQGALRAVPHQEAFAKAKVSALRALAMDDECADAQFALGHVLFLSEWDWVGAERSFQRVLDIDPNHTEAYLLYGALMEALGRLGEGLRLKQRALERDPSSPAVLVQIAVSFWNQRRYEETVRWLNRALERDPRNPLARELLAGVNWKLGDFERVLAEDLRHAEALGLSGEALTAARRAAAAIKSALESGGPAEGCRYILEHMPFSERGKTGLRLPVLYGEAGDLDAAFDHLDRALDIRDPGLVHLAVAPQWDRLRGDPRFDQRLARMGLSSVRLMTEEAGA